MLGGPAFALHIDLPRTTTVGTSRPFAFNARCKKASQHVLPTGRPHGYGLTDLAFSCVCAAGPGGWDDVLQLGVEHNALKTMTFFFRFSLFHNLLILLPGREVVNAHLRRRRQSSLKYGQGLQGEAPKFVYHLAIIVIKRAL